MERLLLEGLVWVEDSIRLIPRQELAHKLANAEELPPLGAIRMSERF
jgi:hypothetical protein